MKWQPAQFELCVVQQVSFVYFPLILEVLQKEYMDLAEYLSILQYHFIVGDSSF